MNWIKELDMSQSQINTERVDYSSSCNFALLRTVVAKREGKGPFGRPRGRGENPFQTCLNETVLDSVERNRLHGTR